MRVCLSASEGNIMLLLKIRTGSWVFECFLEKFISFACFEGSGLSGIFQVYTQLDIKFRS